MMSDFLVFCFHLADARHNSRVTRGYAGEGRLLGWAYPFADAFV